MIAASGFTTTRDCTCHLRYATALDSRPHAPWCPANPHPQVIYHVTAGADDGEVERLRAELERERKIRRDLERRLRFHERRRR